MASKRHGFTIVELLIVIVVIAILATISIISYNGIQSRATNASILNGSNQALKLITAYTSTTGQYPYTGTNVASCVSQTCSWASIIPSPSAPNPTMKANLETIGTLPGSMPATSATVTGIAYQYVANRTVDGIPAPAIIVYGLQGAGQTCGQGTLIDGAGATANTVTTPYSISNPGSPGNTVCVISLAKP